MSIIFVWAVDSVEFWCIQSVFLVSVCASGSSSVSVLLGVSFLCSSKSNIKEVRVPLPFMLHLFLAPIFLYSCPSFDWNAAHVLIILLSGLSMWKTTKRISRIRGQLALTRCWLHRLQPTLEWTLIATTDSSHFFFCFYGCVWSHKTFACNILQSAFSSPFVVVHISAATIYFNF